MNAHNYSDYSGYSANTISGAGYSITPGTPAGYYIAAVIPEWSNGRRVVLVTPDSIIGVSPIARPRPERGKPRDPSLSEKVCKLARHHE